MKVSFSWNTRDALIIRRISKRFKVNGMTVNRESTVSLNNECLELLKEDEKNGYIRIRKIMNE